jgi:hypothetical protein
VSADSSAPPSVPGPLYTDLFASAGLLHTGDSLVSIDTTSGWQVENLEMGRLGFQSSRAGDSLILNSRTREMNLAILTDASLSARLEVVSQGSALDTLSNNYPVSQEHLEFHQVYRDSTPGYRRLVLRHLDSRAIEIRYILDAF